MSGVHSGLQAEIRKASPESVYIHCYGHVLNLVMSKCTSDSGESRKLFGLLTSTAVFMSQSHKRMDTWKETIPGSHWKLQKIGETRWWSKDVALKNVFGSYESPNPERLATLLKALKLIESSKAFDPKATFEASALRQSWERFETILCAFVFLKIFQYSTPVSKYLQTSGLDVMTAYTMADNLSKTLTAVRDQFSEVHQKAAKFANDVAEQGVDVAHELQCIRKRKKKRLSTEESNDDVEALGSSLRKFEIETYKATADVASAEIDRRFSKNRDLYQDLAVLEPRRFADTKVMLESNKSLLSKISRLANVSLETLREELVAFANCFHDITAIKGSVGSSNRSEYADAFSFMEDAFSEEYYGEDNNGQNVDASREKETPTSVPCLKRVEACQQCIPCAFKALHVITCM